MLTQEEYGKAMRSFREDRGFSLRIVADGIINPATLAKFERGETALSFENLFPLLEKLNVTVGEFIYQASRFDSDPKTAFFNDLTNALLHEDVDALQSMATKIENQMRGKPSKLPYAQVNLITIRAALALLQDPELDNADSLFASEYFFNLQHLYYYDLQSLRFICNFFNKSETLHLSRTLFAITDIYAHVGNSSQYVVEIALAIVERLIVLDALDDARKVIVRYRREKIINASMIALLDLKELSAAIDYIEGKRVSATDTYNQVINTLRWLSFDRTAKQLIAQWKKLTQNS